MNPLLMIFASMFGPAPMTPTAADNVLTFYLDTNVEVPAELPGQIGNALERRLKGADLWPGESGEYWKYWPLKDRIEWARQTLAEDLPPRSDLQRLPDADHCRECLAVLAEMRRNNEKLAAVAPPWFAEHMHERRIEVDAIECFFSTALAAHQGQSSAAIRRQLAEIRSMVRPVDWHSSSWPVVPYWQIPRH